MKTLQIDNQKFDFVYSESAKCYMSTQYVNDIEVNFEIYEDEYNQSQIDWDLFVEKVGQIETSIKDRYLPVMELKLIRIKE